MECKILRFSRGHWPEMDLCRPGAPSGGRGWRCGEPLGLETVSVGVFPVRTGSETSVLPNRGTVSRRKLLRVGP